MKKLKLFLLLLTAMVCGGLSASAQYNYEIIHSLGGSHLITNPLDMTSFPNGDHCILGGGAGNIVMLKKLDANGSVIFDKAYQLSMGASDQSGAVRFVQTLSGGYIATGAYWDGTAKTHNPFAVGFDAGGNLLWSKVYNVNPTSAPLYFNHFPWRMDIARVEDDNDETYFIICNSEYANGTSPITNGAATVTKIDVNGNMQWSTKYRDVGQPSNVDYRDVPTTICYGNGKYFIAGIRFLFTPATSGLMFYMTIDQDGNIIDNFRTQRIPSKPEQMDAIYDPNEDGFAMGFTYSNPGLTPNSWNLVGFLKWDINLGIQAMKYYYHAEGYENYGCEIRETADGNYVIGSKVYDTSSTVPQPGRVNISLLKIQKNGTPLYLKRFNIHRNTNFTCMTLIDNAGSENYVLGGWSPPGNMHILSTDANGEACGSFDFTPISGNYNSTPVLRTIATQENWGTSTLSYNEVFPEAETTECNSDEPWNKPTNISTVDKAKTLNVYPTLLNAADDLLHMDIYSEAAATTTFSVHSIDGRLVAEKPYDLQKGDNKFSWQVGELRAGNYIMTTTLNGERRQVRLSKL